MRAIIAGGGNVGRHLSSDLIERGHDVTLIEQEPGPAAKAERQVRGAQVIMGDACELWVLEKAKIETVDVVVAATGDDEDNLVISLLAKGHVVIPQPEAVLAEGDEVIVLTAPQAEAALRQAVVGQAEPL